MDARAHYERLFAYDAWANRETLGGLCRASPGPDRARPRLAHLLSAERLWLERALGPPPTLAVWPDLDLDACGREIETLAADWARLLCDLDDAALARTVAYVNTRGERWHNRLGEVLDHVLTHSAYHRGQIASDLRQVGGAPPYTDYIHAARSGALGKIT